MKKINFLFSLLVAALAFVSCNNTGYQKTKSGLMYKIIGSSKDSLVKEGNILKINYTIRLGSNDSIIQSSYGKMPAFAKVFAANAPGAEPYNPSEVFSLVHKGDSVVIVQLVDTLLKQRPMGMPPFLKKGDKLITTFKVIEVFNSEELARTDNEAEMTKERARMEKENEAKLASGIKEIENWLAQKNIKAQQTGKGTFVAVTDPGTGMQADSGKFVSVRYTGKKLSDGSEFESNNKPGAPPLNFTIGAGEMITGMDEGVRVFKKGGKGVLYIPGSLAYGANPQPGSPFKPFDALIFEIEVLDVLDKAPQQPQMPQQMPMPMPEQMPDTTRKR
ncbi:MAG: FKBP-type peptidyl-prolyl cis-trans isomerase [Gemmatimonadaceae bacterium]|nr:FKBP-type peptidyl-prolyl cis-trans isomerase [Chitinophagaceae bacterium]